MREILFRAKRHKKYCKNQDWTYGVPVIDSDGDCVMKTHCTGLVVYPETVGQYTGLTDKNGKKIFEGDIVESRASEVKEDWKIWQVGFVDGSFVFDSVRKSIKSRRKYKHEQNLLCVDEIKFYGLEIVGNIHDNPELLKGGDSK